MVKQGSPPPRGISTPLIYKEQVFSAYLEERDLEPISICIENKKRKLVFQSASTYRFENPIPNCLVSSPRGLSFIDILPEFLETNLIDQRQNDNPPLRKETTNT